jgi:hypothetical protein
MALALHLSLAIAFFHTSTGVLLFGLPIQADRNFAHQFEQVPGWVL